MSSHRKQTIFNTCFKVPIDPCNNCPVPRCNRQSLCFDHDAMTTEALRCEINTSAAAMYSDMDCNGSMCNSNTLSSLAEFYDSIPDYCEINHLPAEEFYTTLKSLKILCQDFKFKSMPSCVVQESTNGNSPSTISTHDCKSPLIQHTTSSRYKPACDMEKSTTIARELNSNFSNYCSKRQSSSSAIKKSLRKNSIFGRKQERNKEDVKNNCKDNVNTFESGAKFLESDLKSDNKKTKSALSQEEKEVYGDVVTKIDAKKTATADFSPRRNTLRKWYSLNNISNLKAGKEEAVREKPLIFKSSNAEILRHKECGKLSNYFIAKTSPEVQKTKRASGTVTPTRSKIPEFFCYDDFAFEHTCRFTRGHKKRKKQKRSNSKLIAPFQFSKICHPMQTDVSMDCEKPRKPSPVHPVARPNLAAVLRAEVSRKKRHEMRNNCIFRDDVTPSNDWEVRNTPAWKSLALNESHNEILALRLATRKAEQALQRRIHDHNMELMRQRVKATPLLLEGPNYWSNSSAKLTHNCKYDIEHASHTRSNEEKQRSKTRSDCARLKGVHSGVTGSNVTKSCAVINKSHTTTWPTKRTLKQTGRQKNQDHTQLAASSEDLSSADRSYL